MPNQRYVPSRFESAASNAFLEFSGINDGRNCGAGSAIACVTFGAGLVPISKFKKFEHVGSIFGRSPLSALPGGSLRANEVGTSHTLLKHVDVDDGYLVRRANGQLPGQKGPQRASRFFNEADAEIMIGRSIDASASQIDDWLASASKKPHTIYTKFDTPTGWSVPPGGSAPEAVHGVTTVLTRDPNFESGYRILTAFPDITSYS